MRNGDIILEPPDGLEQPVDLLRNPSKLKKFPNKAINRKNLKKVGNLDLKFCQCLNYASFCNFWPGFRLHLVILDFISYSFQIL